MKYTKEDQAKLEKSVAKEAEVKNYRTPTIDNPNLTVDDFKYTVNQVKFCYAVVELGDYSAAYRKAYNAKNMNSATIGVKASQMMAQDKFKLKCEEIRTSLKIRNEITLDEIVTDLANMARFDIAELYTEDGNLKPIHDMPIEARRMISSLDIEALYDGFGKEKEQIGHIKKVKLINRLDVLEKLMKYFDGYNKHNQSKASSSQVMIIQLPDNQRDETVIDV